MTGVLVALATPAAVTVREVVAVAQDCGGGSMGSGGRACVASASTATQATGATFQACGGGGTIGSGTRDCPATTAGAIMQACTGYFGSGHRTCAAPALAVVRAPSATLQDCTGGTSTSGGRTCVESAGDHATIAV